MKRLFAALLLATIIIPRLARAEEFNMNYVLSDEALLDVYSMSQNKIQEFLNTKPGILKSYKVTVGGVEKTAAQIIYDTAQQYQLNPKFLLVKLQKEESLIEDPDPSQIQLDWATGFGVCDSCDINDPELATYKGFFNQLDWTGKQVRKYLTRLAVPPYTSSGGEGGWAVGKAKTIECISSDAVRSLCTTGSNITITPANSATVVLYTYTPHPGGNYLFWKLWNRYSFNFHRQYPDGSLLRSQSSKKIYLVQDGKKRMFANDAAFLSRYSFNRVIEVPEDSLWWYDSGKSITYANYSLLQPKGSPGVYLLVDDVKRPIQSKKAFRNAGFQPEEVVKVSWNDLTDYPDGEPITMENIYPSGVLFQHKKTGAIFFVKDGVRHPVVSKDIMRSQFGKRKAVPLKTTILESYAMGSPVGFKDGELVTSKNGGPVYVISNGLKLPIDSKEVFDAYKFKFSNVIRTTDGALAVHPDGPHLTLETQLVQTASTQP